MAKRSWPFGVTSWDDTVKFAQLLFGVDVVYENYAERLPHRSDKSFLLFAKGACAEGRPFFKIGDLIAPQLEEIQRWEENVRNSLLTAWLLRTLCSQRWISSNEVAADAEC